MRLEFDRSVPVSEQRDRVRAAKEPGRKHQKRPGAKAVERAKATARRRAALLANQAKKHSDAVAAYWRGEAEMHPDGSSKKVRRVTRSATIAPDPITLFP